MSTRGRLLNLLAALLIASPTFAAEPPAATAAAAVDAPAPAAMPANVADLVDAFIRDSAFLDIALSPTGEFFAATVPRGNSTILVIVRREGLEPVNAINMPSRHHVGEFWWVNPTRVVASVGRKSGSLEQPLPTGELVTVSTDGGTARYIAGFRASEQQTGTHLGVNSDNSSWVFMVDDLPHDDARVLVSVEPMSASRETYTTAELMDVKTGRRTVAARAPVRRADFLADRDGVVRFATGSDSDNMMRTYYRASRDAEWTLVNDQAQSGVIVTPLGFSADGATAYLRSGQAEGPDAIERFDIASGQRSELLRDPVADPHRILRDPVSRAPIGVEYMDGAPRRVYFEPESAPSRTSRSLSAAFPGQRVLLRSVADGGNLQLALVTSDRNPGDYFVFDKRAGQASFLVARAEWLNPDAMAERRPVKLKARDGLALHGYLTLPRGVDAKNLPLVVHPHGGPFDVRDDWDFDFEPQLLAARGYAVLQVNFRGSAGFGASFERAGYRQWGKAMQDDLTDATKWAIAEGIADPRRICLYGSSYGAYAALMGAVREPALYACVAGNIGVYDLPMMYRIGDVQGRRSGANYMLATLGEEGLEAVSPTRLADRIEAPVFLAAGGEDERAPAAHTKKMAEALQAAGVPVEVKIYETEGHGYYDPANRRDYFTRLLAFLDRHLAAPAAAR